MAHAGPADAGTDQQTTRDGASAAFTGVDFTRDWNDTAGKFGSVAFDRAKAKANANTGSGRRYRGPGHPLAAGDGRP